MEVRMPYPQDRTIRVGSLQARYWAEGNLGTPVILIHGLGGYVESWRRNILPLSSQHRVFAVDLPGFGQSDRLRDGAYNLQTYVQFISEFLEALGLERAHIVGHSLGGCISLQFTFTYPEMVDRLVLVSSGGLGREMTPLLRLACLPVLGEILTGPSRMGSRLFLEAIVNDKALIGDEDVQIDYELSKLPGMQQALLMTLRTLGSVFGQKPSFYEPILEKLATITQPTLVIWGRQDSIVPVSHADVARRIPNSQVQILERCSHYPQFEHPQEFNQLLQEFLCEK
jgi:4,5:9,10-diseco-3-hydroxy-5,9,17-trioxoandrosta-1(10),2-diene-4-oate hydrolase